MLSPEMYSAQQTLKYGYGAGYYTVGVQSFIFFEKNVITMHHTSAPKKNSHTVESLSS